MALGTGVIFEVRATGSNTNGSGWLPGSTGVDYSQQDSPQYALTNGVTNASTTVGTVSAAADMVGNVAYIAGGTGSIVAGWYRITAVSVGVSITVDRATGLTAGTGVTINVGGALASVGVIGTLLPTGCVAFIKAGTYTISSTTSGASTGPINCGLSTAIFCGYSTNRYVGNTDAGPVLQLSGSSLSCLSGTTGVFINLVFDGASQTSSTLASSSFNVLLGCTIKRFTTASGTGASGVVLACLLTGNGGALAAGWFAFCEAYGNTSVPWSGGGSFVTFFWCLSYSNTGASTDGFQNACCINCFSALNGNTGFRLTSSGVGPWVNCHAEANTTYGYEPGTSAKPIILNCSHHGNTSGGVHSTTPGALEFNTLSLSASPFIDQANFNFSLNNLSGAGAALRAAGVVGYAAKLFPRGVTTAQLDIGAVQSRATFGGFSGGFNG